jgi:hypothetical protein
MVAMAGRKPNGPRSPARSGTVFVLCCALIFVFIAAVAAYFLSRLF